MTVRFASRWAEAMGELPRECFLPEVIYRWDADRAVRNWVSVSRTTDPDLWRQVALAADAVVTQVDDGHTAPDGSGSTPTSSASHPDVVSGMLDDLDPHPGERILEIGTGTGWNAALLAHQIGARNVVSVELDSAVARQARAALTAAGLGAVRVITGDGLADPPEGVFDRIIATVGVRAVPWIWVLRTRIGGRIVAPLINSYEQPGVAVLDRDEHGAHGHLGGRVVFMPARSQRDPDPRTFASEGVYRSRSRLQPHRWISDRDAAVAIGQRVSGIRTEWRPDQPGSEGSAFLTALDGRSWAEMTVTGEPPWPVRQYGPRRLFTEVRLAYKWWIEQGKPSVLDWRVTVTPSGQRIDLNPAAGQPAVA